MVWMKYGGATPDSAPGDVVEPMEGLDIWSAALWRGVRLLSATVWRLSQLARYLT